MSATATRSYTRLAIAVVVAVVIISATTLSYASFESTVTKTSVSVQTTTTTETIQIGNSVCADVTASFQLNPGNQTTDAQLSFAFHTSANDTIVYVDQIYIDNQNLTSRQIGMMGQGIGLIGDASIPSNIDIRLGNTYAVTALLYADGVGGCTINEEISATQTSTTTFTETSSATTNATTATIPGTNPSGICVDPGQSGGAFFRVLNDSTSLPLTGVSVTAVADGSSPDCSGGSGSTVFHETYTFTTNQTEWYSLDVIDIGSYNFTVSYSGHTYSFVISLRPVISSCGTLYLPSGKTSTPTYPEPGTACN